MKSLARYLFHVIYRLVQPANNIRRQSLPLPTSVTRWNSHVNFLNKVTMKKSVTNIKLSKRPAINSNQRKHNFNKNKFCYRRKSVQKVDNLGPLPMISLLQYSHGYSTLIAAKFILSSPSINYKVQSQMPLEIWFLLHI